MKINNQERCEYWFSINLPATQDNFSLQVFKMYLEKSICHNNLISVLYLTMQRVVHDNTSRQYVGSEVILLLKDPMEAHDMT